VSHDDVVAVLGHEFSGSAVGASVVYEQHGVLFLASTATSPRLTEHNFNFVFRLTPDDRVIAQAIADFAKERHFKKVGVVYARTEDGEEASDHVISGLRDAGIDVALVRSYMPKARPRRVDYRPLAAAFKEQPLDAVVLADELPRAAGVIDDFVRMGYTGPILATDKLDSVDLSPEAGPAADSVYVASAVDPTYDGPAYRAFRDRFRRRWGRDPGYRASQGYEAMHLLIDAVLTSRSADPIVLATTLRTRRWEGLFGRYSFDEHGEIVGRQVSIKHMQHGRFETVERITTAGEQQKEPERQDQQED
jgi:branched-chain amino acid transport system substrate-binding protein